MIDSLEDYHTCTVCARPVHDYGPEADAVCEDGAWFHRGCFVTEEIVTDQPSGDDTLANVQAEARAVK